jgi:HEPN domain-containing protein
MSPEAERAAEAREWLAKVALDLRGARIDLEAVPPLVEDALFHCQQAIEKTLKALLVWHDTPFRKTHSLEEIGRICTSIDSSLDDIVDEAAPLTEYAWAFRYPGAPPTPERREAEDAVDIAERVVRAILDRLPESAVPRELRSGSK